MAADSSFDPEKMLCYCLGVRYGTVEECVRTHGCSTVPEVTGLCKAGGGCKSCHPEIEEVIAANKPKGGGLLARLGLRGRSKGKNR